MNSSLPPTSGRALVDQELLVLLGAQEAPKGVLLHQGEDPLLGQVEGHWGQVHKVSQGHVLGEMVNVHLCVCVRIEIRGWGERKVLNSNGSTSQQFKFTQ